MSSDTQKILLFFLGIQICILNKHKWKIENRLKFSINIRRGKRALSKKKKKSRVHARRPHIVPRVEPRYSHGKHVCLKISTYCIYIDRQITVLIVVAFNSKHLERGLNGRFRQTLIVFFMLAPDPFTISYFGTRRHGRACSTQRQTKRLQPARASANTVVRGVSQK